MTSASSASPLTGGGPFASPGMRQPLNLPAGSVRALLTCMVVGTVSVMLLVPETSPVGIPLDLYYLLFLLLGHYFAVRSHGRHAPEVQAPPLHLPHGTFRFLLLVGFSAVLIWGFYNDPRFAQRLRP